MAEAVLFLQYADEALLAARTAADDDEFLALVSLAGTWRRAAWIATQQSQQP
jgi:hypothetical protein